MNLELNVREVKIKFELFTFYLKDFSVTITLNNHDYGATNLISHDKNLITTFLNHARYSIIYRSLFGMKFLFCKGFWQTCTFDSGQFLGSWITGVCQCQYRRAKRCKLFARPL